MAFKIKIGGDQKQFNTLQLIPNPDGIQPTEYCWTCGRESAQLYWNGRQTICTDCEKNSAVARKLKIKTLDDGIPLDEFFSRLQSRTEVWDNQ